MHRSYRCTSASLSRYIRHLLRPPNNALSCKDIKMDHLLNAITTTPISVVVFSTTLILALLYHFLTSTHRPTPGIPTITLPHATWRASLSPQDDWIHHSGELLSKGSASVPGCFQVYTGTGYKTVVPNRFANELKSNPDLSFSEAFAMDFQAHYPGFDGLRQQPVGDKFIPEVIRKNLTQSLGLVTEDLVEETDEALRDVFGEWAEWTTRKVKQDMLDVVARLSSRVFLGKDLCRNAAWLEISKNYTVSIFVAAQKMRSWSAVLRPVAYWFIPACTSLRSEVRRARKLIDPEVEQRREHAEAALAAGGKPPKAADTIGWMVEAAKGGQVDYVGAQL